MADYIRELRGHKIPKINIFRGISSRGPSKIFSDKILETTV